MTRYLLFGALIFLNSLFLGCDFCLVAGELVSEKSVLLEFKLSLSDPSGILSSWDVKNLDYCSWYGLSCDSNFKVSSLNISGLSSGCGGDSQTSCSKFSQIQYNRFGNRRICSRSGAKLVGKLPHSIGKLTQLRVLSLPCNDLRGEIPSEIWSLEKLEVLDLGGNSFKGRFPDQVDGLRKLRVWNLGFNGIYGEIPFSITKCVDLEVLNLAGNRMNGTLPSFLGNFPKLKRLYLSQNRLTGYLPAEFGNSCLSLEHLDLSGNYLVGSIPSWLGNCKRQQSLLLFSNKLNGVIPNELGQLQMLEVLDVSRNSLSGSIPPEVGRCVKLSVLVLTNLFNPYIGYHNSNEYNHFEGPIPEAIIRLPKLSIVWAPRANLEGKLPSNWGDCENLEMLNLAQNFLTGEIIGVFRQCKKLHYLDLSSNKISGKLDEELHVPCMAVFDVSNNIMTGPIPKFIYSVCTHKPLSNPDHIGELYPSLSYSSFFVFKALLKSSMRFTGFTVPSLLVIHNFGGNKFSGSIESLPIEPKILGKETGYAFFASGNKLNGLLPASLFEGCDQINGMILNISFNKFTGRIPMELHTMCKSLRVLDISNNQISGSISPSLGGLKSLVVLDLSGNTIQGHIPSEISLLKHLKYLSMARNNLTGEIPSSFTWLSSLEVLDLSSNKLYGEIPQGLVHLGKLTVLLLHNNKLSGKIPSGLSELSLLSFNVSFNSLSGSSLSKNGMIDRRCVLGKPCFYHPRFVFLAASSQDELNVSESSRSDTSSGSENLSEGQNNGLNSIEIASVVSASVVVSVLLALIILFIYTRKWAPHSRIQVSESREITIFTDIGVPLTFEAIAQATGNFSNAFCIGNGGFGATYRAEIYPGTLLAVKKLAVGRCHGIQQFDAEIKILEKLRHPNLVTLIGYHASDSEMFLIYNYLPGGNLEKFIKDRSAKAVEWKILHKIALDIAQALAYLHDQCVPKVLHRDVKPSNILLDKDLNAYLSDFGLSRLLGTSESHATTGVAGTFGYVAPEYAMTCRLSEKSDVYSYGVVLLELISDKKALDPSFSSQANGFNIVSWARMLLGVGRAKEVFTAGLWDSGPYKDLVLMLHLAITCTDDSLSTRPTMKQVLQRLKHIRPLSQYRT